MLKTNDYKTGKPRENPEKTQTWNLSKSLHMQGFSAEKFYPQEPKLQQMPNCDKTAKIITPGVFTLDNLNRVILPR